MNHLKSTDGQSGLFFIIVGAVTIAASVLTLEVGTPSEMGAGFFPLCIGILLLLVGGIVTAQAFVEEDLEAAAALRLRPLFFVVLSIVLAGLLLLNVGLVVAIPVLVIVFSLAMPERHWPTTIVVAILMTVVAYLIFILGLHLRIPLLRF